MSFVAEQVVLTVLEDIINDESGNATGMATCGDTFNNTFGYRITLFNLSNEQIDVVISLERDPESTYPSDSLVLWLDLPDGVDAKELDDQAVTIEPRSATSSPLVFLVEVRNEPVTPRTIVARLKPTNVPASLDRLEGDDEEPTVIGPCETQQ